MRDRKELLDMIKRRDKCIEELEAKLDVVRKAPRYNYEKAKGMEEYRVVQDDHGEFMFCDDIEPALQEDDDD